MARAGEEVSDARSAILARLAAAQRTAHLPGWGDTPRHVEPATASPEECLDRFRTELAALGVENHVEATPEDVRGRVAALIAGNSVLSWDREQLPYELGAELQNAVFAGDDRDAQAKAEVGFTGCDAAIAETGSLVMLSTRGKSRAISLLPPVHLALVRRSDLYFSMGEFLRARSESISNVASCTFITGPSRTADIELTLTLGVHGPGRVAVVIGP